MPKKLTVGNERMTIHAEFLEGNTYQSSEAHIEIFFTGFDKTDKNISEHDFINIGGGYQYWKKTLETKPLIILDSTIEKLLENNSEKSFASGFPSAHAQLIIEAIPLLREAYNKQH